MTSFKLEKEFPLECVKDIARSDGDKHETIIYTDEGKYHCGMRSGIFFCSGLGARMSWNSRAFAYFRNKVVRQKGKKMVVLDFSSLRSLLEKGGIMLTTLRCPHCSAPITMPKDGTEILCDHCGNMIYAQDIFEKIQAL